MGRSQIVNLLICCTSWGKRIGKKGNLQFISHPPVLSPVLTRCLLSAFPRAATCDGCRKTSGWGGERTKWRGGNELKSKEEQRTWGDTRGGMFQCFFWLVGGYLNFQGHYTERFSGLIQWVPRNQLEVTVLLLTTSCLGSGSHIIPSGPQEKG